MCMAATQAGTLKKADVQALYPPPLVVGEKLAQLPVWPVFRRGDGGLILQNHVFETIDLEPAPGYVGKPINLLVVTDASGVFVASRVIAHNELAAQAREVRRAPGVGGRGHGVVGLD